MADLMKKLAIGFLIAYVIYLHVAVLAGADRIKQFWDFVEQLIKDHPGMLTTTVIGAFALLPVLNQAWNYLWPEPEIQQQQQQQQ